MGVAYLVHILVVEHSKALPLLLSLIHTELFNQARVWLKYAECLHALNELEHAALLYAQITLESCSSIMVGAMYTVQGVYLSSLVLGLAPRHTQTRLTLAILYSVLDMTENAFAGLGGEMPPPPLIFIDPLGNFLLTPINKGIVVVGAPP